MLVRSGGGLEGAVEGEVLEDSDEEDGESGRIFDWGGKQIEWYW